VESHFHLDKSRIMDRTTPSPNRGRDHMQRVSAVKPGFTVEDVYSRARATLEQCILHGTTHVRTHVEVDPNVGMVGFEALQQLAQDYRWAVQLELCVFAQEGWSAVPEVDDNVVEGLKRGASAVGGAPAYDEDRAWQISRIFELAVEHDRDVDIHLDVGTNPDELDVHLVCELTEKHAYGGRVAVGHGTKYSALPPQQLRALARRLADVGVTVTVLPATDLFVMGRDRDHNIVRGVTDANALLREGVNCCLSTNNVLNPFTPFGDSSMARIANLYAHTVQRGSREELEQCFAMISERPARLLGLRDYGIALGNPADLVVWDAESPADVIATVAHPRRGFKGGRPTFTRGAPQLHRP
jgi:cytosine deaminase